MKFVNGHIGEQRARKNHVEYTIWGQRKKDKISYSITIWSPEWGAPQINLRDIISFETAAEAMQYCEDIASGKISLQELKNKLIAFGEAKKLERDKFTAEEVEIFRESILKKYKLSYADVVEISQKTDSLSSDAQNILWNSPRFVKEI